jgi:uncharacterized protein involved in response to NO
MNRPSPASPAFSPFAPKPAPPSRWPALTTAPHRLMFFIGAANVLAAMLWWWMHLSGMSSAAVTGVPAPWLHGLLMQYQVLPTFMFGFLLTVFPRWLAQREATRWHYLPVGLALLGGQAATLVAAWTGSSLALELGLLNTLAGWIAGLVVLAGWLRAAQGRDLHAMSAFAAMTLGLCWLVVFVVALHLGRIDWMHPPIRLAAVAVLMPVYVTVAHRVFPFFAGNVVPGYTIHRPAWALRVLWIGIVGHVLADLSGLLAWRWLPDLLLVGVTGHLLWRWWPRAKAPPLLIVLFAGFAWLPLAMAMHALDSMSQLLDLGLSLGRAPLHALAVGFFGTVLVAMATRVTAGHSGRPLVLGRVAAFAFVGMQLVALSRVIAEWMPDPGLWWRGTALAWVLVFLPWVLRSAWIYATPRLDGKPG